MSFLASPLHVRMTNETRARIEGIVNRLVDKYENESHFVRCAVLKLLKEEEALLRLKK